jgi:hypothetical protein
MFAHKGGVALCKLYPKLNAALGLLSRAASSKWPMDIDSVLGGIIGAAPLKRSFSLLPTVESLTRKKTT